MLVGWRKSRDSITQDVLGLERIRSSCFHCKRECLTVRPDEIKDTCPGKRKEDKHRQLEKVTSAGTGDPGHIRWLWPRSQNISCLQGKGGLYRCIYYFVYACFFPMLFQRESPAHSCSQGIAGITPAGLGVWEEKRRHRVQKVTSGPVVLGQLHHRASLPRVLCQAPKERVSQQMRSGTEVRGSLETGRAALESSNWSLSRVHSLVHRRWQRAQHWHTPVSAVLSDLCIAEAKAIHSEGKTGLEHCSGYSFLYFLVILLMNIHSFYEDGVLFCFCFGFFSFL